MNRKEYMKYHQEMKYYTGKPIIPGDVVVINNNDRAFPYIGVVDHFTERGNVAILYNWVGYKGVIVKSWAYRKPTTIIKLRSGKRKKQ